MYKYRKKLKMTVQNPWNFLMDSSLLIFLIFFFLNLRSPDVTFVLQIKREKLNALQSNKYKTLSKNLLKKPSEKKKRGLQEMKSLHGW